MRLQRGGWDACPVGLPGHVSAASRPHGTAGPHDMIDSFLEVEPSRGLWGPDGVAPLTTATTPPLHAGGGGGDSRRPSVGEFYGLVKRRPFPPSKDVTLPELGDPSCIAPP